MRKKIHVFMPCMNSFGFFGVFHEMRKKKIHFCIIFVSRRMCGAKLEIVCKKWCHMKNVVVQIN